MRIALAQTEPLWEAKLENFRRAERFLKEAKEQRAEFILFPEMSMTGFSMHPEKIGERAEEPETLRYFAKKAVEYGLYIGMGYVEYREPKSYNRYAIISSKGEILTDYRKIHPFTFGTESVHYAGGDTLNFCKVGDWTVSPFICYDLRFPEVFQLASPQAELIVVPANWPEDRVKHFKTLLKARAIENQCYIAGINRVGHARTLSYSGESMVVDPLGKELAHGGREEALLVADLDLDMVRQYRTAFPAKQDRKPELYRKLEEELRMKSGTEDLT